MSALIGVTGMIGALVSLVLIIIKAVKKQPKKKAVISLIICFVLFVIGVALPTPPADTTKADTVKADTTVQTEEPKAESKNEEAAISSETEKDIPAADEAEEDVAAVAEAEEDVAAMAESEGNASLTVEEVIDLYRITLDSNFKQNNIEYSIEQEDNVVTISTWSNGMTQEAMAAKLNGSSKSEWDEMTKSFVSMQESLQNVMNQNGHGDVVVAVALLNDVNRDNILLYVGFGTVLYDSVNDINLLG